MSIPSTADIFWRVAFPNKREEEEDGDLKND
jgi:hypothetical protein